MMKRMVIKTEMDGLYKGLITAIVCLLLSIQVFGQDSPKPDKFNFAVNVGYPMGVYDVPNLGFHFGISPRWRISQFFTIETQISYTHARYEREEQTNAHDGGQTNSYNAIFGPRFYLLPESKDLRPYVHTLIGYGAAVDREYDGDDVLNYATYGLYSFSLGAHVEYKNKFNFGAVLEGAYTEIIVKLGYTF